MVPTEELFKKPCIKCDAVDRLKTGDCRPCNAKRCRNYQKKHHEQSKRRVRIWLMNNPERARLSHKRRAARYRKNHPERCAASEKRWRELNPERWRELHRIASLKHWRKFRTTSIHDLTEQQWISIQMIFGYRCAYCGKKPKKLTQDHVIPVSRGGSHTISNVVPACASCNSRKGIGIPLRAVQPVMVA